VRVVIASQFDRAAVELVQHWAQHNWHLLVPADLSRPGWRDFSGGLPTPRRHVAGKAVIAGRAVSTGDLSGVLVRLPIVMPMELRHIVPEDRDYVAAEMTAFLVAWLSRISCPVINRPTPLSLCGPMWRKEQWACVAAQFGIRVSQQQWEPEELHKLGENRPADLTRLVIVGDRCIGNCTRSETSAARHLARAIDVTLLQLDFVAGELVSATSLPSFGSAEVRDAVLNYFMQATS
jgi:hypothetical protein